MSNLSSRVSGLRSQGLSFSRDGLDITLDVPDTRDVKEIFGTMATTMETQDGQLSGLHRGLEETSERTQREQRQMMEWATKKFEEMQKENELLREKLESTKREFKNFTFNIQGFDDDAPPRPKTPAAAQESPVIVEASPSRESGFAMFSTEQGAAPDILTKEDGEDEREEAGPPAELPAVGSQRKFGVQRQRSMKETPGEVLRGWWKKAITAVIIKNRTSRLCLGFTKTRVQQSQSVVARLQRVEDRLFELPISLLRDVEYEVGNVNRELSKEIRKCESAVEEGRAESQKSLEGVTLAITSVRGDVQALDGALRGLGQMVEARTGNQAAKLEEMERVGHKVSETEALLAQNLRKKIKNLMTQMKSLSALYEEANALVYGLMARNAIVAESSGEESIVMLLKLDAQLRQARESVMAIDGASAVLGKLVANLKEDILSARHGSDSHIDDDDRDDLIGACDHIFGVIDRVNSGVKDAQDFCKKHDEQLADRWMGFASVITAAKSTASLSAKLKVIQTELEEKPTQDQLREAVEGAATDITPIANQITELKDIIARQAEEMQAVKAQVVELQDKQLLLASTSNKNSRPASAVNNQTVLPPIQATDRPKTPLDTADLGASLEPMIKDIIDAYMKAWTDENMRGEEQSVEWVDNQQDDDSWYQGGSEGAPEEASLPPPAEPAPPAEPEPEPEQPVEEPAAEQPPEGSSPRDEPAEGQEEAQELDAPGGGSLEITSAPVLEDYLPTDTEVYSDRAESSRPASRESSRPASRHGAEEDPSAPPSAPASARVTPKATQKSMPTISPSKPSAEPAVAAMPVVRKGGSLEDASSRPPSRPSSKGRGGSRRASEADSRLPGGDPAAAAAAPVSSRRPSRGPSGRPNNADKADSATVLKMREELKEVANKIEAMYANKMDAGAAQSLLRGKADKISLSEKADVRVIETIEQTIGKVAAELGDLREMQKDGLKLLKEQMAAKLDRALKDLLQSERDSTRGISLAATKSFCLSCGRESVAKQNAMPLSPRGYLPSLNRSVSPGPDIHRGGFKMPVSAPSGSTVHKAAKSAEGLPGSPASPGKRSVKSPMDQMLFSRSLSTSLYNTGAAATSFNDDDSVKSGLMQPVPDIPIVAMPIGTNVVRPMYRKGFPAKKSSRPIVFSHEPFDPTNASMHLSGTLNVSTVSKPGRR